MITEQEYAQLVEDFLGLLRQHSLDTVAERLRSIISKPIIDESPPESRPSKDISESSERAPTSKEQFQEIVAFLEARLVHPANAVSRMADLTRYTVASIQWAGGEDAEGQGSSAESLAIDKAILAEIVSHLRALQQATGVPDSLHTDSP